MAVYPPVLVTRKEVVVLFAAIQDWLPPILNVLILLTGLFMILLVLIQKGKGGGLAGAFGGAGGSSAFGSRSVDQFARITLVTAAIWVLLIMLMAKIVQPGHRSKGGSEVDAPPPGDQQTRLWHPESGASSQESGVSGRGPASADS
jgi:preprotein translocase subunit SecG